MIAHTLHLKKIFLAAVIGWVMMPGLGHAAPEPFDRGWLELFRQEAINKGVRPETAERLLHDIAPLAVVEDQLFNQPEFTPRITLSSYLNRRITPEIIARGRGLIAENSNLLRQIQTRYNVPAEMIVAIWSIETNFGDNIGESDVQVIPALVTLARADPKSDRRQYFRNEAIAAMKLIDEGYRQVETGPASRAGAFGQTQFMPGSFHRWGIDYDNDGIINIWNDLGDIFASTANHLAESGWINREIWGQGVTVPQNLDCRLLTDRKVDLQKPGMKKSLAEWSALGVRLSDTASGYTRPAALIAPNYRPAEDGDNCTSKSPFFITYDNFWAVINYNSSYKYALAVNKLADALRGREPQ